MGPKALRKQVKTLVVVINLYVLLISLVGCEQSLRPSIDPFEQFCGLAPDRFATIDEKGLRQWIRNNFSDIPFRRFDNWIKAVVYDWDQGEAFLFDGHLAAIQLRIGAGKEITLGQVVDRLGPPKVISTSMSRISGGAEYIILLDYFEQGLLVGASIQVQSDTTAVELTEDIRVEAMLCFIPGSTETLKRLDRGYEPELRSWMAWPGFGALMTIGEP